MDAAAILERLTGLGVKATVEGRRLRFEPGSRIPPDLVEAIRTHKQVLMLAIQPPEALTVALTQKNEEILTMRKRLDSPYYADDTEYHEWCRDQITCLNRHIAEMGRYLREGGALSLPQCCKDEHHLCLIAMRRFDGCLMGPAECGFSMREQ